MGTAAGLAAAVLAQTELTTIRVVSGLSSPLYVTHAPGDFSRIFIVEQGSSGTARIKIAMLPDYTLLSTPFFTISGILTGGERGLLGLAFHPDYARNGYFFVNYTTSGGGAAGQTVVARYRVSSDPNLADPNSGRDVLRIPQPFSNHNGGWIAFGPDGYLYIGMGDGGSGGDPGNRAQNLNELLGKTLRIDVNGDDFPSDPNRNYAIPPDNPFVGRDGADEIWNYGMRNHWRNSFDRATGDLYFADVGQNLWEEVSFQPAGSRGGENYGWRCYEGRVEYNFTGCSSDPNNYVFPFHVYNHGGGRCSITGGYVYRGCAIPDLEGTYFFADYCSRQIWSTRYEGLPDPPVTDRTAELAPGGGLTIANITSFGEDAYGELYICDGAANGAGEVFKIVPRRLVGPDCNANGRRDECDILDGSSRDSNGNGVPDECECPGDVDGDGDTDLADLAILLGTFGLCPGQEGYDGRANLDQSSDGCVTQADLAVLLAGYPCASL